MKAFAGMFETHLTVRLPGRLGQGDQGLARWAQRHELLWLHADSAAADGPRSKDLYDAVILAEDNRTHLSPGLLRTVMRQRATMAGAPASPAGIEISPPVPANWSAFVADNPRAAGPARDWLNRLTSALASMKSTR